MHKEHNIMYKKIMNFSTEVGKVFNCITIWLIEFQYKWIWQIEKETHEK